MDRIGRTSEQPAAKPWPVSGSSLAHWRCGDVQNPSMRGRKCAGTQIRVLRVQPPVQLGVDQQHHLPGDDSRVYVFDHGAALIQLLCSVVAAAEALRVHERLRQRDAALLAPLPARAESAQVQCQNARSEIGYLRPRQHHETGVVGDRGQPLALWMPQPPSDEAIPSCSLEHPTRPAEQTQPPHARHGDVVPRLTDQKARAKVVVLVRQLFSVCPLTRLDEAHDHLLRIYDFVGFGLWRAKVLQELEEENQDIDPTRWKREPHRSEGQSPGQRRDDDVATVSDAV